MPTDQRPKYHEACDAAWCGYCCLVAGRPNHRDDCPFNGTFYVARDRLAFALWVPWRQMLAAFYRMFR
jgi:hypothetical protein